MTDFEIVGTVVERGTKKGVQGLHAEAWDRDVRFHSMLGCAVTDGAGRFHMRFTDEYFGDYGGDKLPDLFYRLYRDDRLILSTQDHPSMNVKGPRIVVTLEVDPLTEPAAAADRVDADTAIKALTFLRESDFRGIGRQAGDTVKLAGGLLGGMLVAGFKRWDWEPVGPSGPRQSDVVNQDTQTAQARLAAQNITVDRVEEYHPDLDRNSVQLITATPVRLAPGERVVLYQQDGKVKYYARVKEQPAATIDQAEVQRLGGEVAAVRSDVGAVGALRTEVEALKASSELDRGTNAADLASVRSQAADIEEVRRSLIEMRAELAQRNQTIAGLQADLANLKASQERIERTDLVQRIDKLESTARITRPGGPTP